MRTSADETSPFYTPLSSTMRVFDKDGNELKFCIEAHPDMGRYLVYLTDEKGNILYNDATRLKDIKPLTKWVFEPCTVTIDVNYL